MYRLFLLINILSLASIINAQKLGIPEIEYFNRRQYGGATQNWKVSQSADGLMYFANNNGLLEYDGVSWSLHNDMNAGIVRSVKCIGNKIYLGTNNDFGYFEYDSSNHFTFNSLADTDVLKNLGDVWTINKWNDKIVFHTEAGIVLYENQEKTIVIPSVSRFISCFVVNEMLLVQDEEKGLLEVRGERIFPVSGGEQLSELNVSSIIALSESEILISTMNKGLFTWDLNEIKAWEGEVNSLLIDANVFCGERYDEDILLFGTIQNGLIVANNDGDLVMEIDKDKGLMNNTILGLFVDKEGGVWCGLDNGIARISLNNNVSFISGYYNLGTGYVQERYGNDWFFGTNQAVFKIADDKFKNPLKDRTSFTQVKGTDGQVWSFFKDEDNLLCGHNRGVFEIVGNAGRLITPSSVNGVWNFKKVPGRDDLMISGTYNGLILFDKQNNKWVFKQHLEGFIESSRFIEWDAMGRLWISHDFKGVYCISFSDDYSSINKVTQFDANEFSDTNNVIVSKINNQIVIIGSRGLYRFSSQGIIERFEELDPFFSDSFPSNIEEDLYGNLWLIYPDYIEVLRYLEDGSYKKISLPFIPLEKKLVNGFESVYVSDKENVFFGIEDGYAHYVMQDYNNFRIPFNVHLRMFRGRADSLVYTLHQNEDEEYVQSAIPVYPFKKNFFAIDYAATFYSDKDLEYSTYLSGFDDEPTDWGKATRREFTKLREGDYYFTVKARNRYGVQSLPLTFQFKVLPPWHRHTYAKIGYLVIMLIVVFVVTQIFNRRIEASRQNEKLKARQRYLKKEEQLTSEALRAEKEVIKMRNDKLRSEMKFKENELAGLTVHIIQKNDLLSELQGQLNRIKKIKTHSEIERKIDNLVKKIRKDIENENNWESFEKQFEQVHHTFLNRLMEQHNDLSDKEKKLCAYIKMGMASKEIASLMNISTRSVENNRYKLRQKLGLQSGDDLSEYIGNI
ncbi:MAG: LuxR C-terminal-related transcriptional regulator [Bacteroidales bacterium]|nr:LuxR C-terminal-related transcriptional regulator [Bacteroidales bacterium]